MTDPSPTDSWWIRPATPPDTVAIHGLIRELAAYEREPDAVRATEGDLEAALFCSRPRVHCQVAELADPTGSDPRPRVVGIALWFVNFSTWRGRHGIWLEDLFVQPQHRGLGIGAGLLRTLAEECAHHDYARLEWSVLDWNESAIGFYRSLGAIALNDWTTFRLADGALGRLARRQ